MFGTNVGDAEVARLWISVASPTLSYATGPDLPFSPLPIAAVQLHQTGHSSIAQHFRRVKVGRADEA
ncbi:hypothetical protein [Salipiger sp. PrR002]|uniref:hypothetical protein n=1 Tax=Salipiger sp. PrR002 TaxID=2706489 RepID=UPI0013B65CED|nr:hypothetical protein [Salipiger sp. PrR002]NDW60064.1 hypothetical protein [Salipiger sp. PrR004]